MPPPAPPPAEPVATAAGVLQPPPACSAMSIDDYVKAHELVAASGVPNYRGCRIPVKTGLNPEAFRRMGGDFHDPRIIECIAYGFPISYEGDRGELSSTPVKNHAGARENPDAIDQYLAKEIELGAIIGPFDENPLSSNLHFNPVNAIDKNKRIKAKGKRIIHDCSHPKAGLSVNSGIAVDSYDGQPDKLTLPTTDHLAIRVRTMGVGALMWKRDLKRAFRQFPTCPGDIPLLAFTWRGKIFIDVRLAMGLRSAGLCCQRVTDIFAHICGKEGIYVINYYDDLSGANVGEQAMKDFQRVEEILKALGLEECPDKACPPSTEMEFLGVDYDSNEMTMSVTPERVNDTKEAAVKWDKKTVCSQLELQQLLGELQFVCRTVRQGRIFITRLLHLLSGTDEDTPITVTEEALKDIRWFHRFLDTYNGISIMPPLHWARPDEEISSDACLVGLGAACGSEYYHFALQDHMKRHISELEILALVAAVALWREKLRGKRVLAHCENMATVEVVNRGRTKNQFMAACLRELCYISATVDLELRVVHLPGVRNRVADLLSRWDLVRE